MLKKRKFVIIKKPDGMFQFLYQDWNGQIILNSGSYTRKMMCFNGIESIKRSSRDSSKFNKKISSDGSFYFNVKSFNGKIIAISKLFEDRNLRNNEIDFIKTNIENTTIEDQSKVKKEKNGN